MSETDMRPDGENPPFVFEDARMQGPRDPRSADAAKLRRMLRRIVDAHKEGAENTRDAAIRDAETALSGHD